MKHSNSRREFSKLFLLLPFASTLGLAACGGGSDSSSGSTTTNTTTDTSTDTTDTSEVTTDTSTNTVEWQSGGTDLITVDFPDDSIFDATTACALALTKEVTLGPCYFENSSDEDISEGKTGLPMQLCLQLIDSNCQPLSDYVIEVWHCDTQGIYSGDTSNSANASSFAGDFCTGGDSIAEQNTWYRGKLTTNSSGRVNFKTCFPGWYRGRTIHIHFTVKHSSGLYGVTSQFCFTDEFTSEICTTHELYSSRGEQDTPLSGGRDTVFPSTGYEEYILNTEQNSDGTLLAYHTIQIS